MYLLSFNGSPRKKGNSSLLLRELLRGACDSGAHVEELNVHDLHLKDCRGCLRCNLIKRCALRGDDWPQLSQKIQKADVMVFASPVYFHHVPAPLKNLIDRFRSFVNVRITETGLQHTPWQEWKKEIFLILSLGSSSDQDAIPAIDLFSFFAETMGHDNRFSWITATRLAVVNQVKMTEEDLEKLYRKIKLPLALAKEDYLRNQDFLKKCYEKGRQLTSTFMQREG
jgi:multimeric flavodoxin WrbA